MGNVQDARLNFLRKSWNLLLKRFFDKHIYTQKTHVRQREREREKERGRKREMEKEREREGSIEREGEGKREKLREGKREREKEMYLVVFATCCVSHLSDVCCFNRNDLLNLEL